jgi:hypothetical protein
MKKYKLTPNGLRKIFRMLLQSSAMTQVEMESHTGLYDQLTGIASVRKYPRRRIDFPLHIYDGVDPVETGFIEDVSSGGIKVRGIRTRLGERRTFIVRFPGAHTRTPFAFQAICRWVNDTPADGAEHVAGFEITSISRIDAAEFQKLLSA